jgi:hypothetical protein
MSNFRPLSLINRIDASRRLFSVSNAAGLSRSVTYLCAVGMASLLSACGGGSGGSTGGGIATFTIGGTLSGLANGQTLDLAQGSEILTLSTNGAFTFATLVTQGGNYEVKVSGAQPAWQTCSVSNGSGSAVSANASNVTVNCVSTDTAATGLLNDTGIDWCTENITTPSTWVNNAVCSAVNWVGNLWGQQQDAFFGRDAQAKAGTLTKVGGGMAGFDFTKIGASGKALAKQGETWSDSGTEAAGTQWDCVRDNVTSLVWEVKRNDATHLRHMDHGYAWYNPDSTTNGGAVGYETPQFDTNGNAVIAPTCVGVADVNKCNTQSYVTAVNAVGLCGKTDWRLPIVDELRSLAHTGRANPAIDIYTDTDYFPNASTIGWVWSSSPHAAIVDNALNGNFDGGIFGHVSYDFKYIASPVRLVRSGL